MSNTWNDPCECDNGMSDDWERDLRLRNQVKRMELTARYGARMEQLTDELPVDIEAAWLDSVERFEEACAHAKRTTVREFLGDPSFAGFDGIHPDALDREITRVLELYRAHNIEIDFLCEVQAPEIYRFLTEELPDAEMDDIRIEGWICHFIYEEFHPNDEYDVKEGAVDFLTALFWLESELVSCRLAHEDLLDASGCVIPRDQLNQAMTAFRESFDAFDRPDIRLETWCIDGDAATVTASIEWTGHVEGHPSKISHAGLSTVRLVRSPYGGWDVRQVIVPGWNAP